MCIFNVRILEKHIHPPPPPQFIACQRSVLVSLQIASKVGIVAILMNSLVNMYMYASDKRAPSTLFAYMHSLLSNNATIHPSL